MSRKVHLKETDLVCLGCGPSSKVKAILLHLLLLHLKTQLVALTYEFEIINIKSINNEKIRIHKIQIQEVQQLKQDIPILI